ncbi:T9SS type A sorting domain-containing protein [Apibacter sp. HY039]|uniref:T9SS type A sorting domain-containing protein n=1 Tax=Apibacter sp. HY039 TaxID=2501476 RepID=UPI0013E36AD4|nr:T9SS type A sorting domain-containing protein [Apibacter sp. HY039]
MKKIYFLIFSVFAFTNLYSQKLNLTFEYDGAGNQIIRKYVSTIGITTYNQSQEEQEPEVSRGARLSETKVQVFPNPVLTILTIQWENNLSNPVKRIELLPYNSEAIENVSFKHSENKTTLNMTDKASGVYYLKIHFTDGVIVNHKLIKN